MVEHRVLEAAPVVRGGKRQEGWLAAGSLGSGAPSSR
jgi:hypothetical protein